MNFLIRFSLGNPRAITVLMQGRRLCTGGREIDECAVTDISGRVALEGDLREAVRPKSR